MFFIPRATSLPSKRKGAFDPSFGLVRSLKRHAAIAARHAREGAIFRPVFAQLDFGPIFFGAGVGETR